MGTNLMRDLATVTGNCFLVTPYGVKTVANRSFDFDEFHRNVTEPTVAGCGLTAHRADSIYGPAGVLDTVWRGIQQAEVVIVDFTGRSPNVAIEFGWALVLGKRIIILTQHEQDIPTDVRGLYRHIRYSENFLDVQHMTKELHRQLEAILQEPADEKMLSPMVGGIDPAPAVVIALDPEFATVKTDDGRHGILTNTDVDWSRVIKDMTGRYRIGERIDGAFVTDTKGSSRYTMLAGRPNPWPKLLSDRPPGTSLTGVVQNVVAGIGAFVQVGHGVNGLIPAAALAAHPHLGRGSTVEVTVHKIDDVRRRVDLRLERALNTPPTAVAASLPAPGAQFWAELCAVKPVQPNGSGGFLLLKLPGRERPAILPGKTMSTDLRQDFDQGDLRVGDELHIEVVSVDPGQNRILVRDVLAPEESGRAMAASA